MAEPAVTLSFERGPIVEVQSVKTHRQIGGGDWAEVVVVAERLVAAPIDYTSKAQLLARVGSFAGPLFTGQVTEVTVEGELARIRLATALMQLSEARSGGLSIAKGTDVPEAVWSILRIAGFPPDQIDIGGWAPKSPSQFEVAVRLDGLVLTQPVNLEATTLVPTRPPSALADLPDSQPAQLFSSASAWAVAQCSATSLYEAETDGLRAIDEALAWLAAIARFTGASFRGTGARNFKRAWSQCMPVRGSVVSVRRIAGGGEWLRGTNDSQAHPALDLGEISQWMDSFPSPSRLTVQLREALLAWRRAADSSDPVLATVSLWDAIEFYAAGARPTKIFDKGEMRSMRAALETLALTEPQRDRLGDVIARVNELPLLARLRDVMNSDQVPFTDAELEALKNVRKARNDLVHGRSSGGAADEDLRAALSLVNRMLVYAIGAQSS